MRVRPARSSRHIRDNRLYEAKHATFEAYVERSLGYTEGWASQRISLADTVNALYHGKEDDPPTITTERQARAIKPVLRDHGPEVAAEVLREAADDDGKITARSITEATSRVIEPEVVDTIPGEDYRDALDRYPELDVPGAEAGEVVEIASMIDARNVRCNGGHRDQPPGAVVDRPRGAGVACRSIGGTRPADTATETG